MSHISLSLSQAAFEAVYNRIPPTFGLPFDGSTSLGPLWIGVEAEVTIDKPGKVDFEDGNTFLLREMGIGWKKLILRLGFDIPTVGVGRFCLFRIPRDSLILPGECLIEFPGAELFGDAPDVGPVTVDLSPIFQYIVTEVSGRFEANLVAKAGKLALRAHAQAIDVDPISINDTVGKLPDLLKAAVAAAALSLTSKIPQAWLLDAALGLLGFPTVTELLLNLLDIEDDVEEWLMDVLNVSIGIDNLIGQAILNALLDSDVIELPDPYEFMPKIPLEVADYGGFEGPLPAGPTIEVDPPKARLANASSRFDADRLHIHFDFGS